MLLGRAATQVARTAGAVELAIAGLVGRCRVERRQGGTLEGPEEDPTSRQPADEPHLRGVLGAPDLGTGGQKLVGAIPG